MKNLTLLKLVLNIKFGHFHIFILLYTFKNTFKKGLEKMYFRENTSKYLLWINHKIGHFLIRKVL